MPAAPKAVFLLVGNEEFLKDEWLRLTRQRFFKEEDSPGDVDFNRFYASEEIDLPGVLTLARTQPFLSNRRLIIIKDIEDLSGDARKGQLLAYVKSPSADTVMILETGVNQRDLLKNAFLSQLSRFSETVYLKKLYDRDLSDWIGRRFAIRKKKAAAQAVELLKQLKGNNLRVIDGEIEKLSLYVDQRELIAREDVQELVGRDVESGVNDIIDAISCNDKGRALAMGLEFQKKDLPSAAGLFCWNLRKLLKVKECLKEGHAAQRIGEELSIQKFQTERFINQAKGLKASWIKTALLDITDFDLRLKTAAYRDSASGWQMLLARLLAAL